MQHLKNSIKNVYRSKGKSILFVFLVFGLTVLSGLSLSIWVSIDQYLDTCDDQYDTIGILEYMSPEYPDETVYDPAMQEVINDYDFSQITNHESVMDYDASTRVLGSIDGFTRNDHLAAYLDKVILTASLEFDVYEDGTVEVLETNRTSILYSAKEIKLTRMNIAGVDAYLSDYAPGHHVISVIFHGAPLEGSYRGFDSYSLVPVSHKPAMAAYDLSEDTLLFEDITGREADYTLEGDTLYADLAKSYASIRNSVDVYMTDQVELMLPIHQKQANIIEGHYFTEAMYANDEDVCIITEVMASKLDVSVGDTIHLSLASETGALSSGSYLYSHGFNDTRAYEVVGIIRVPKELNFTLYTPKKPDISLASNQLGYTLGTLHIDNASADAFYNDMVQTLPQRFHLTLYDQGYGQAAKPLGNVHRIAIIMSITGMLATLLILILYGYLFVYRQRMVSDIMIKLGTGKGAVFRYFLYGSLAVSITAGIMGIFASNYLMQYVERLLNYALTHYEPADIRFSNSNLSMSSSLDFVPTIALSFFILVAIGVIVLALVSCLSFVMNTFKAKKKGANIHMIRKVKKSSTLPGGFMKYSMLSLSRGWIRSSVILFVLVGLVLFIGQLTNNRIQYEHNIDLLKEETIIEGHFTDIKGRLTNRNIIEAFYAVDMYQSGFMDQLSISKAVTAMPLGLSASKGVTYDVPPLELPAGGFARERFLNDLKMGTKVIFTNDIRKCPEFYYSEQVQMTFLEGYDESIFSQVSDGASLYVVLPRSYMETMGYDLGDTLRLYIDFKEAVSKTYLSDEDLKAGFDFKIVGSFEKEGTKDYLYVPLNVLFDDLHWTDDSEAVRESIFRFTFDSVGFTLKDTSHLDAFRSYLEDYGFSEVNHINTHRSFLVLDDKAYISTLEMMHQQLDFIGILYPILYVVVFVIALIVGYLVTLSRRKEFYTMRGLGVSKTRVAMTFLSEQLLLALISSALALIISLILYRSINSLQMTLILVFNLLFLVGTWLSIIHNNRHSMISLLKAEE